MSQKRPREQTDRGFEQALFGSRWILAPFYAGLALSLFVLLIKFAQEFWHIAATAISSSGSTMILGILTLVDLTLMGSLLVIVIFSGYENFVSKIDHSSHRDWPEWMGKIDFSGLKLKLLIDRRDFRYSSFEVIHVAQNDLGSRAVLVRCDPYRVCILERLASPLRSPCRTWRQGQ